MAERGFSQKRACELVQIDPKTVRREPEQGDAEVRERLRSLAAERRRFGYRRLGILLEREGMSMNKKRLFRFYSRGRPGGATTRPQRWSLDFVADSLSGGEAVRLNSAAVDADQLSTPWALTMSEGPVGGHVTKTRPALERNARWMGGMKGRDVTRLYAAAAEEMLAGLCG